MERRYFLKSASLVTASLVFPFGITRLFASESDLKIHIPAYLEELRKLQPDIKKGMDLSQHFHKQIDILKKDDRKAPIINTAMTSFNTVNRRSPSRYGNTGSN